MEKCCKTCRNYKDGRCYSNAFVAEEIVFPEVYIDIDACSLDEAIKEDGLELKYDDVEVIAQNARYVATYDFEKQKNRKERIHNCRFNQIHLL
ncbi:MAG: hypothetical protein PHC62_04010 [Candidatus Izemoplasmatales bacterium]|nr:hypothetical protein [Candidatus Izemoplasmatales bacterium]